MLLKSPVNFLLALLLSAIFTYLLLLVRPEHSELTTIIAAIFSAAGTIVALALPAAELGGNSVIRTAEYWLERAKGKDPPNLETALHFIDKTRRNALTARRGSLYVLFAFLVSGFALFFRATQPTEKLFLAKYLLTGIGIGFLLFGSILFFPFAWAVYRLNDLNDVREYIVGLYSGKISQPSAASELPHQDMSTDPNLLDRAAKSPPIPQSKSAQKTSCHKP